MRTLTRPRQATPAVPPLSAAGRERLAILTEISQLQAQQDGANDAQLQRRIRCLIWSLNNLNPT